MKVLHIMGVIIWTLVITFCFWFGVSYIEVLMHNLSDGVLSFWNMFNVFM